MLNLSGPNNLRIQHIQLLNSENINLLVDLEQNARLTEPEIFIDNFDACAFKTNMKNALNNHLFSSARCMMCVSGNGQAIGRLDFSIIPSFSFGTNLQVYVDWVYVLKEFRQQGVAKVLFKEMEAYIKKIGISEYFLLTAENSEAQKFYRSFNFAGAEIENQEVLRKYV